MNRRDLLKFPAAVAALEPTQSLTQTVAAPAPPATAQAPASLGDPHQDALLATLADLIIPSTDTPGAAIAGVPGSLTRILVDGPVEYRRRFVEGLSWLDGFALRTHNKPFGTCTPTQQVALLESLENSSAEDLLPGRLFVGQLKGWTARLYYASREGMAELNKGGRVPATFACQSGDHP